MSSAVSLAAPRRTGFVEGWVRTALQLEGLVIFAVSTAAYFMLDAPWWLYALVFFAPDLSFLAYLANKRAGAFVYNLVHTYSMAIAVASIGHATGQPVLFWVGLILLAHAGFDRTAGYGLKYATDFGDTHLGRKGKAVV